MAGHSHSQNVAGRKNAEDKKKAQTFTKFFKEILGAMKIGGPDEEKNPRLKHVLKNARAHNVPKSVIESAREAYEKRGGGGDPKYYEGFGSHSVAMLVEANTDNLNRTSGEVKHFFSQLGGSLSPTHHMFQHVGIINIYGITEEEVIKKIENLDGLNNMEVFLKDNIPSIKIITETKAAGRISNYFSSENLDCDIVYVPIEQIDLTDDQIENINKHVTRLFNTSPDIIGIYTNVRNMNYIENPDKL